MNLPPCELWGRVGSFHMGAPVWKDKDFLFLYKGNMEIVAKWFEDRGWTACTEKDYLNKFRAWRKGDKNTIVIRSDAEFFGFMAAFHLCKTYKIFNKSHRVMIHEAMRQRTYTPCDFNVNNETREVTIIATFANDKDQTAKYQDDEPPY